MTTSEVVLTDKSILVVDDETDIRKIIVNEMQSYGIKTFEAENGKEAFEIVQKNHIDLVISDVRMPFGDGIELLQKIKAYNPDFPMVILMTGFADLKKNDALKMGAVNLLKKPPDWDELVQEILNALLKVNISQ